MRGIALLLLLCLLGFSVGAQSNSDIMRLEYGVDEFPLIGAGTKVAVVSPSADISLNTLIALNAQTEGTHLLYVRVQNRAGVWSPTYQMPYLVIDPSIPVITKVEYSFDTFMLEGGGTVMNWPVNDKLTLPLNGLSPGVHMLYFRAMNQDGQWSAVNEQIVYVSSGATKVKAFRYYFQGTAFTSSVYTQLLTTPSAEVTTTMHTEPNLLESGKAYTVFVAPIDDEGKEGQTQSLAFTYGGIASAVSKVGVNGITFYPNPATTEITIVYDGGTGLGFKFFNMGGSIVKSGSVDGGKINVSDLPKGKYLILFENEMVSAVSDLLIK